MDFRLAIFKNIEKNFFIFNENLTTTGKILILFHQILNFPQ